MSGKNDLTQTIKLDTKDFVGPLKQAEAQVKSSADNMNKSLTDNSKSFVQNEGQIKKWGHTVGEELKKFKDGFASNLATGAKALTLGLGSKLVENTAKDAISMAMEASKTFADLKSRTGASDQAIQKWDKAIGQAATRTKANVGTLTQAFSDLSESVDNPDKLLDFMDTVGQATTMNGGNSGGVTDFIKKSLGGQGKDVNKQNVNDLLGGADILRRNGKGFGSMGQSMSAIGGMDQDQIKRSGLSSRDLASILAGASQTKQDPLKALEGIKGLISTSTNAINDKVLGSILGVGSLNKNGKFDISKLGSKSAMAATMHGSDEAMRLNNFKSMAQGAGLSEEQAEAAFKMIRNFNDLNATLQKSEKDQKSFAQSAAESADNLKDNLQMLETSMTVGFKDILGGFAKPLNSLLKGNVGDALSQTPGAVADAGAGIKDHPMLAGGALLATAAGGALLSSLLPKLLGSAGGKLAGAGNLAKEVGIGSALKSMGVTPVYVVNASDMGKDQSTMMSTVKDMMGSASGGPMAAAVKSGFLGKLGAAGAGLGIGVAVGGAINSAADNHAETNQFGQKYNIFEKAFAKLTPEALGGMSAEQYKQTYTPQEVVIKIKNNARNFSVEPEASDNVRDARVQ